MFETVVIATDGSESAERAVRMALDIADRFEATVHALSVVDAGDVAASPDELRDDLENALTTAGGEAVEAVETRASEEVPDCNVVTAVEEGDPVETITDYADDNDADVIAMGTRGRHGDHAFLLGSVAEGIVRHSKTPVLTVRQLSDDEIEEDLGAAMD
ncbi:universal stress protein [Salinibaculum rarum]|jgi:nucleotide-binding universal stress UspA family protein|uniref:universal stress protein n=1 Tax=Salinibaculum rarum TaxID=3058903 RepID=UPI00265F8410|nr:universal stress protein [Salinibaculum sp. KK48]